MVRMGRLIEGTSVCWIAHACSNLYLDAASGTVPSGTVPRWTSLSSFLMRFIFMDYNAEIAQLIAGKKLWCC